MNASTVYQRNREKLLSLLTRGADILQSEEEALPSWECTAKQFRATRRKLLEDQFSIVLLAEMKGGKSTTFNAVACDGRELSPVGTVIRTSACLVRAQNLADTNERERAEVEWREPEELIAGFDDLLLPHLRELAPGRFEASKDPEGKILPPNVAEELKLTDPADRDLLRRAAERERDLWQRSMAHYDPENRGYIDVFRFALLIATFYGHEEIKRLRSQHDFNPEDVSRHIQYPEDWESRWETGDPRNFRWDEIVFAFVRSVSLFLHAPKLEKIGAALVDCPGLFASRFDTAVADEALAGADAILYLLPGERQIALSNLDVLRQIQRLGMEHKLFFAWNMRTSEKNAEKLLSNLKATLKNHGFKAPAGDYLLVHAGLALRAEQAEKLIKNAFDQHTRMEIVVRRDIEESEVPEAIWGEIELWQRSLFPLRKPLTERNPETVQAARAMSRIGELIAKSEDFVVQNKASFVLVENGADVITASLREVEGGLQQRESQALQKVGEHQAQFAKADLELRNFQGRCESILTIFEARDPDASLAAEFAGRLDKGFQKKLADEMTERIFSEVIGWDLLWKGLFQRKEIANRVNAISKTVMSGAIDGQFRAWVQDVEKGTSPVYHREIARRVDEVRRGVQDEWSKVAALDLAILKGIPVPALSSNIREAVQQAPNVFDTDQVPDPAIAHLQRSGALVMAAVGAAIGAAIALHVAAGVGWLATLIHGPSMAGPIGWALSTLVVAILAAFWLLGGKGAAKDKLAHKIEQEMNKQWATVHQKVKESVEGFGFGIRYWYREAFRKEVVGKPRRVFEERKADAERLFCQSQERRDKVAADAKAMREQQIEPLRRDLETFAAECRAAMPKAQTAQAL
jgi:hypothetical protein